MPPSSYRRQSTLANDDSVPNTAVEPVLEDEHEDSIDEDIDDDDEEPNNGDFPNHAKMPAQHPATRTTAQLMELMSGDKPYLDLNPHYQRNIVWTRKAKKMLIDSMFRGFFIPPVIFNVTKVTDEHGILRYKRTCVDGKQRLTSIRDFMRGRFPWKLGSKEWYFSMPINEAGEPMVGAKNKPILPEKQKDEFRNKHLLCVEYVDLTQTQEIELFQRVQLGKPLTKAETFKATQGPWQDLGRKFEEDYAEVADLPRQNNRASQFWGILSCFTQIYECMYPSAPNGFPKLKTRVPQIEKLCSDPKSLDRKTASHLRMVFDKFTELLNEDRSLFESSKYQHTKVFSPIELLAVCCLLSQWGEQRPLGMLQGDIRLLRDHLRQSHSDLRTDQPQWKTCWNYIDDLESIRGAVGAESVSRKRFIQSSLPIHPSQPTPKRSTPQSTGAKRGRKPVDNDGDDDFRPSSTAKRNSAATRPSRPKTSPINYNTSIHQAGQVVEVSQPDRDSEAEDSSGSSPWDSDDEREKAARRAARVQKAKNAPVAPMGNGEIARKRPLMDLGGGGNTAQDLETKKARTKAARIKQED